MKRRLEIARGPRPPPRHPVPRRADHRARSADARPHLGGAARPARELRDDAVPHHPLHGRGRELRSHRHHRPRQDRRARHAGRAQAGGGQGPGRRRAAPSRRRWRGCCAKSTAIESMPADGGLTFMVAEGDAFIVKLLTDAIGRRCRGSASAARRSTTCSSRSPAGRSAPRGPRGTSRACARQARRRWTTEGAHRLIEVVYALWRRDMVKFLRDRRSLITSLTRPFLWLLAFGFGLRGSVRLPGRRRARTSSPSWSRASPS